MAVDPFCWNSKVLFSNYLSYDRASVISVKEDLLCEVLLLFSNYLSYDRASVISVSEDLLCGILLCQVLQFWLHTCWCVGKFKSSLEASVDPEARDDYKEDLDKFVEVAME